MKRSLLLILCACIPAFVALGCGAGEPEQKVPDKSAFDKKAPPPDWRGPGQAGAPGGGPGAGAPPGGEPVVPDNIKNGTGIPGGQ